MTISWKKINLALIVVATTICNFYVVHAEDDSGDDNTSDATDFGAEMGGYLYADKTSFDEIQHVIKFTYPRFGHGFAAERANNLYDKLSGINSEMRGDNCRANGEDRAIIGNNGSETLIQDKYYSTAQKSIDACFDELGNFRYVDADENPMVIEVPKDQYSDAVEVMKGYISEGKIPGVTEPEKASDFVKEGRLTLLQSENLCKAGNIDSLKYDAANGIVYATSAVGISFTIDFVCRVIGGEDWTSALGNSSLTAIKTGAVTMISFVTISQLSRTTIWNSLASPIQKVAPPAIITVVLSAGDIYDFAKGRISSDQLMKNFAITVVGVSAGYLGSIAGGTLVAAFIPGVGPVIGSIAGGTLFAGAARYAVSTILKKYTEDDTDQMSDIIANVFTELSQEYLVTEDEASQISDSIQEKLQGDVLKDMFASKDRESYARSIEEPLFSEVASNRSEIDIPSTYQLRSEYLSKLTDTVLVH